jgi:branched-chain amino acid transport system permease protein
MGATVVKGRLSGLRWYVGACVVAFICALIILPRVLPEYDLYIANLMQVNILLAIGMNIVVGVSRQFSLSNAALFGLGAYMSVLIQLHLGLPFFWAAILSIGIAALVSAALSMLAWRVSGVYLAMVTFGFSEIFQFILIHADVLTNGSDGLAVPHPSLLSHVFLGHGNIFRLLLPMTAVAILIYLAIEKSVVGLRLLALGDSEVGLASVGSEPRVTKAIAFAIQGAYAGCAGVMFAVAVGFIDPYSFGLAETIQNLAAIVIGGLGSLAGSIAGAIALTLLDRVLADLPGSREVIYGLALLLIFIFFPRGLAGLWRRR